MTRIKAAWAALTGRPVIYGVSFDAPVKINSYNAYIADNTLVNVGTYTVID